MLPPIFLKGYYMKIKYKILSIIACFSILLSAISISVFAESPYVYPPYDEIVTDGLSNVTFGTVGSYDAYKIQVGSVIPYSFFKARFLEIDNGAVVDSGDRLRFNIFCENGGTLQPLLTTDLNLSLQIYTWNAPYNNNDANLSIFGGVGNSEISVTLDKKPKFTITQDSDGYLYFKYTDNEYMKSTRAYNGGNLYLISALGFESYQNLIADCQRYYNNDSFIENASMYGATADFITFPKTSNDVGILPVYMKSWLLDGYQYPYLEFYIDTNTIHGNYRLEISTSDYGNILGGIFEKYTEPFYSTGDKLADLKNVSNALNLVPDVPVNPTWTSDKWQNEFDRQHYYKLLSPTLNATCAFTNSATITTESFNFSNSSDRIRYYSICLSDYMDITRDKTYRVQIVSDSNVLATTYFNSFDKFLRNSTPVGNSYSVGYTDKSTFDNDASNGSYVSGTHNDINAFNNNDTPSISPNTNLYNNIGNGDFFSALDSTLKGLQGFFYGCYAIIPPAIISIILGSLAIIVVMRVLGR